ncbi:UBX domain-containing protein 11 isoform X8 [Cuculus canorus]|uniref:UBX domain-containing protein 11 isoform X8 n=1 Tax=Cuculus canorus TaxID=55661 RepID=UPI0023AA61C2|nr:UBX domain-containing protein 11 isoform X8 [Cuculus canorus]
MRDNADNIMQGEVLQSSGDSGPSQFLCDSSGGLNIPGAAHADMELMQKIILLEQKIEKQAQEIQLKDRRIAELEEKMKTLQKAEDDPNSSTAEELEFRCFQLQTQIWEMEQFLHDCGLIWVGERHEQLEDLESLQDEEELPARSHWKPGKAVVSKHLIDFDLILEKVKDLNELAEEGASQIEHTPQGARLRQPEPIPLTLYQNGIVLFNGPFRPYEHPSTQQCLQDIVDGYFPSELQMCYPDGIPLQVTDRRNVIFPERDLPGSFPGHGQVLGRSKSSEVQETTKIAELWNGLSWKGPQSLSCPTPGHGQGHLPLDQFAPSSIQLGLEHLQGWGSHHCSGQAGPGPPHPQHKKILPNI